MPSDNDWVYSIPWIKTSFTQAYGDPTNSRDIVTVALYLKLKQRAFFITIGVSAGNFLIVVSIPKKNQNLNHYQAMSYYYVGGASP